jgi:outer membrane protein
MKKRIGAIDSHNLSFLFKQLQQRMPGMLALAATLALPVAQAESLIDAYRLALANDPRYRVVRSDSRATATSIDQARAGFLPTVKLEIDRLRTNQQIISSNNPVFGVGQTSFMTTDQTLSLTQAVFRKDVIERYLQAKAIVRQSQLSVLAAEQDLILRTAAAYLAVLAASDGLALATRERDALERAMELAREKLKMGLGTITGQYDASARFAVTQAREIEAQYKLDDARQGLKEITGKYIATYQSMRPSFPFVKPEPQNQDAWVDAAMTQNLAIRVRTEAVEVARQEIKRQDAANYPSLNLGLQHNRRDTGSTLFGGGSNVATTDAKLMLTVPLYEGGLTKAVTAEAGFRLERTQDELDLERRTVERATRAAYTGTLSGTTLVPALEESVTAQERALEAKTEGYKAGVYTTLAVLDAQRDLFIAKRDFAQSRYDALLAALKLRQAAGTLSEADLVNVNAALQ